MPLQRFTYSSTVIPTASAAIEFHGADNVAVELYMNASGTYTFRCEIILHFAFPFHSENNLSNSDSAVVNVPTGFFFVV